VVNTAVMECPGLIREIATLYGRQCVICSIDARRRQDGRYEAFTNFATRPTGMEPGKWAHYAQELGAGEILITSVERDGALEGYDLTLCREVVRAVQVPVLVCGGAGKWQDFVDGFVQGGASAVCTANIYHFTESSIRRAKSYLNKAGIPVRL